MKTFQRLFLICLCFCLFPACSGAPAADNTPSKVENAAFPSFDPFPAGSAELVDASPWFLTLRIVTGAETGVLVLAENGQAGTGVYTLDVCLLPETALPEQPLQNGQLINIYYDSFSEAWPMQLGGVSAIKISAAPADNRAALYLRVLEDLWEKDSALNHDVELIGVDLSRTSLSPAERSAVGWAFAEAHSAGLVEGTWEALKEQGYITATPLSATGSGIDLGSPKYYFYEWETGCHFSIVEHPVADTYSLLTFNAQKWRSSLGAYFFVDCTGVQSAPGEWSSYRIGSEMIS